MFSRRQLHTQVFAGFAFFFIYVKSGGQSFDPRVPCNFFRRNEIFYRLFFCLRDLVSFFKKFTIQRDNFSNSLDLKKRTFRLETKKKQKQKQKNKKKEET